MVSEKQITDALIAKMVRVLECNLALRDAGEEMLSAGSATRSVFGTGGTAAHAESVTLEEIMETKRRFAAFEESQRLTAKSSAAANDAAVQVLPPAALADAPRETRGSMEEISHFFERDARRFG